MKKTCALVFSLLLYACGDPETSMLDSIEVRPIVNPNAGILIALQDLYATMADNKTIIGMGNGYIFRTTDFFETFSVSNRHFVDYSEIGFVNDGTVIRFSFTHNYDPLTIMYTENYGQSWNETTIKHLDYAWFWTPEIVEVQFVTSRKGLLLTGHGSSFEPWITLIYSVTVDNPDAELLSQIPNYLPLNMQFLNEKVGYILLKSQISNAEGSTIAVSGTTDGGVTWSIPTLVGSSYEVTDIEVIDPLRLVVFNRHQIYCSHDGGLNWKHVTINGEIVDFSFPSSSTGYALDEEGLIFKSADGGLTWNSSNKIQTPGYLPQRISFYNESIGLAIGFSVLFYTNDGGNSWQPLIYPYSYVTNP